MVHPPERRRRMKGLYSVLERLPFRTATRIVVLILGISVILVGVPLLVLPGPGLVTIVIGIGILATQFLWARRLLRKLRQKVDEAGTRFHQRRWRRDSGETAPESRRKTGDRDASETGPSPPE